MTAHSERFDRLLAGVVGVGLVDQQVEAYDPLPVGRTKLKLVLSPGMPFTGPQEAPFSGPSQGNLLFVAPQVDF